MWPVLLVAVALSFVGLWVDSAVLTTITKVLWGLVGLTFLIAWRRARRFKYRSVEELEAAAEAGVPHALVGLAMAAKMAEDHGEAERLLRLAVEQGYVPAMWEMGRLVDARDGAAAAEPWFRMAAEGGHFWARRFFRPGHAYNIDGRNPL